MQLPRFLISEIEKQSRFLTEACSKKSRVLLYRTHDSHPSYHLWKEFVSRKRFRKSALWVSFSAACLLKALGMGVMMWDSLVWVETTESGSWQWRLIYLIYFALFWEGGLIHRLSLQPSTVWNFWCSSVWPRGHNCPPSWWCVELALSHFHSQLCPQDNQEMRVPASVLEEWARQRTALDS